MLQSYDVGVVQFLHDLEFSILISLVLVHLFDGDLLVIFIHRGLEDNPEGSISNHSVGVVGE